MKRVVILGPSGMLGQALVSEAARQEASFLTVGTDGHVPFKYDGQDLNDLAASLKLGPNDTVVNCIGWIPQKATGDKALDEYRAYLLNRDLIRSLSDVKQAFRFQWVQILTDCVFSGRHGPYYEDSPQDAQDLYGLSKIAGEKYMRGAIGVRSSIVGPDKNSSAGLFGWLQSALATSLSVDGYTNVHWNGITTLAFSKLSLAISRSSTFPQGVTHWVPADNVSKYKLLSLFAEALHVSGHFTIQAKDHVQPSDRTLATRSTSNNTFMWKIAGYSSVPTISQLVNEFISQLDGQN